MSDSPESSGTPRPNFFAWLFLVLPGLVAGARFGGMGTFRGMAGAILTVIFVIDLIGIMRSENALPERLPAAVGMFVVLIVLSLILTLWGYRAFCRSIGRQTEKKETDDVAGEESSGGAGGTRTEAPRTINTIGCPVEPGALSRQWHRLFYSPRRPDVLFYDMPLKFHFFSSIRNPIRLPGVIVRGS